MKNLFLHNLKIDYISIVPTSIYTIFSISNLLNIFVPPVQLIVPVIAHRLKFNGNVMKFIFQYNTTYKIIIHFIFHNLSDK